jgi:hypothetical protein
MSTGKPRGNPNMRAGAPSLNPNGRPRRGDALAEKVRGQTDGTDLIKLLLGIAHAPHAKMSDRIHAARELLNRGWGQPIATTEVDATINAPDALPATWDEMPRSEREQYLRGLGISVGLK